MPTTVRGLVLACHPLPTLAVTALVTGLAVYLGASAGAAGALAASVVVGQLSVGWSNDAVDAGEDRAAGRRDKPTVRWGLDGDVLWRWALGALGVAVVLSVGLLGWRTGGLHVVAVLAAWAYNLRLKDTAASPAPYAVAFALVPVVALGVADPGAAPPTWSVVLGAAVGVGAHLANTASDIGSDRSVGRGGLAVRIGSAGTRTLAVLSFAVAVAAVLAGIANPSPVLAVVLVAQVLVLAAAAVWRDGRRLFPVLLLLAAVDAVALVVLAR